MSEAPPAQALSDRRRLHIMTRIDSAAVAELQRRFRVTLGFGDEAVPLEEVIDDVEALVVRMGAIENSVLDRASKLRVIVRAGIGLEGIDLAYADELGITVHNTPGTNSRSVAEHTIALALAATKDIVEWDTLTRQGQAARRDEAPVQELYGKTWGVVGYGRVGREVAAIARDGLGMRVVANVRPGFVAEPTGVTVVPQLDEMLAISDVVSLHVPLTDVTAGLIGSRELGLMRPSAVLVNVARGAVVDGAALLQALCERTIYAAAIDVWDGPYPALGDRLYETPHLVLAPHRAGRTIEADVATGQAVVDQLLTVFGDGQ
ncbi:MAG: D-3-phosphoglycerate dehydrogenase / 2-oxoglutarate reductase [Micromonosporaceae bacterium]|jgi:D-3-phosphoglycerate dehydrogenase|nr:D-3-phosphoglycerate dehydrogenase / 2-oxoglutarate reductase [Micromonosporaceae bacterium]